MEQTKQTGRALSWLVVVGSWGSYTACNSRALGSDWIDLGSFNSWEEVEEELKRQGFDLNGIDAELFIQDHDGLNGLDGFNCDNMHPQRLFNLLKESGAMDDKYQAIAAAAYIEANSFNDWADLVDSDGYNFADNFIFYPYQTLEEVAEMIINECYTPDSRTAEFLMRYFDYEAFARDLKYDGYIETAHGVIAE